MSNPYINRLSLPITTGIPQPQTPPISAQTQRQGPTFSEILQQRIAANNGGVEFSKHAASRVMERNIQLDENALTRLDEGVRIAQRKGLGDTLILVDRNAFIVNVKNSKVITTVDPESLKGNVFTNIDGTVII